MEEKNIVTYELSGGGTVTVLKPFGAEVYAAVVEMDGIYPEPGSFARNAGRDEMIYILDGTFEFGLNGEKKSCKKGDSVSIPNGTRYVIKGSGRSLVIVKDGSGGKTEIVKTL